MNKKWSHCGYPGRAGLFADSRYGRENSEDGQDSMKAGAERAMGEAFQCLLLI